MSLKLNQEKATMQSQLSAALNELTDVENPLLRAMMAGFTTGSITLLTSALILGVTGIKSENGYQKALFAALAGTGVGAIASFNLRKKEDTQAGVAPNPNSAIAPEKSTNTENTAWKDWRNFVVIRKVKESQEITSFYLQPEDKGDIPDFSPGQFLTIKLDIPEQPRSVIRTYSLSDYAPVAGYYRLSIKRESAPKGLDVPPGVGSNFMHDRIQEGALIPAKPPSGKFVLAVQKSTPIVLISNGVGITPMIAMAKAVTQLNPQRPVWFFHGARDGSFHALREDIAAIAQQHPNLSVHYAYSKPRPEDEGHYQSTGYVDVDLIRAVVKAVVTEAEYFLCGSPAFMDSIRGGLRESGVLDGQVFFEMFSKATKTVTESSPTASSTTQGEKEVVFSQSQQTVAWQSDADSLLEFAEAQGLHPDYSCRQGICGTCECRLLEGEIEYQQPPTAKVTPGSTLICIAKPKTPKVVLDL